MNERIEQLAEQAKKYALDAMIKITDKEQALKVYSESYDTKFAELLFNEIANTTVVSDGMFNGNERRLSVELRLGDMVKKISVFGVEE
jgi:hypothetical protein